MRLLRILAVIGLSSAAPAFGQVSTVGEAIGKCSNAHRQGNITLSSAQEAYDIGVCLGVVRGVLNSLVFNCVLVPSEVAIPRAVRPPSVAAAWQAVKNWAEDHPEYWGYQLEVAASNALIEAFPCAQ